MQPDSELTLFLGTIFQDAYEICAELGAGSFGRLYRGRQLSTGQEVAIKILRFHERGATIAASHRERFRREMRLCAELSHPNIIRLIDSGETAAGMLYAVFEFVPGATLERVLASEGKLSLAETARLMTQVLDALSCAHARGIIHRDLKPGNIMITKTGVLRNALILDFGLSGFLREVQERNLPRLTATYEMMGTPGYAAPEQLRGEPPSARSDLYSWGLTFLECVTGKYAVSGSGYEVILNQLGPDPIAIPAWLRDQPIGRLFERVTAKRIDERDVTIDALLRALNTPALEEQPAVSPPEAMPLPDGERRQLTLVSCRSTIPPADGDPAPDVEELDALLRGQHQLFARIAGRNGGHLASVHSNRALLVFGYPRAQEDDARRAARAALQIVAESLYPTDELTGASRARIEVRVGVHTGLVIARELRGASRALQDVVGFTPQVAAALDEIATPGEVLVSLDTQRLLRDEISAVRAGEYPLPGSSRAMPVFRLTGDRRMARRADTLSGRETPLVGRSEEMHQLLHRWGEAQAGKSDVVLISGEAGIGKSRLLQELRRRIPADAWIECRCVAEAENSPLRPIVDMLAMMAADSLESLLARYGMHGAETVALFATLLSVPQDGPGALELPPDRQRELTLNAVLRLIARMASTRPMVLAIADLHWADPTTLELVGLLVQELPTWRAGDRESAPRILVACSARPEFTPPRAMAHTSLLHLARLAPDEVEEMVTRVLAPNTQLPRAILEQVIQRADGVPLFVEEVARALLDARAAGPDCPATADELGFAIPSSLRDLLTARLDRLSPSARETAQLAAVIGREFRYELLRAVSRQDEPSLEEDLIALGSAGLVYRRRSTAENSYLFKHALVRDAAYASMVRRTRQRTHERIATELRERFSEVANDQPELVAWHLEHGGRTAEAIEYWERAGRRTVARGAYAEASRHFERGLGLLERLPSGRERQRQEIALTTSLGTALLATQGYASSDVERTFARALRLCEELGEDVPFLALYGIWGVHLVRSEREGTAYLLQKLRAHAEKSREPLAMCTAEGASGLRAFFSGEFVTAHRELAKATEWYYAEGMEALFQRSGYDGRLYLFGYLAWTLATLGYPKEASNVCERMLALAAEASNPYALAIALTYGANVAHDLGEIDTACELSSRGIALVTEQKLHFFLGAATCVHGWAMAQRGNPAEAVAEIRRGLDLLRGIGIRAMYGYYLSFAAEIHLQTGATSEGLAAVEEALALCETLLDCFYRAELHRLRGELRLLAGDPDGAEKAFRDALGIARRQEARSFELRAATSLAKLLRERGESGAATQSVAGIYDWFNADLDTRDLRAARMLLARL